MTLFHRRSISVNKTYHFIQAYVTTKYGSAIIIGALKRMWLNKIKGLKVIFGVAETSKEEINTLIKLLKQGHIKSVLDKTFTFEEIQLAHSYVDTGHKVGNVVVTISD